MHSASFDGAGDMYDVASGVRVSTTHASFPSSNAIVPRGSLGCEQAGVTRHASNDGRAWRTASRLLKKRAGSMRVFRTSERRSHSQQSVSTMGWGVFAIDLEKQEHYSAAGLGSKRKGVTSLMRVLILITLATHSGCSVATRFTMNVGRFPWKINT